METMFLNLLEVSLGTSVAIVLIILITRLTGRRFSAKWRYWVWILLAIRLLFPIELVQYHPVNIPIPPQMVEEQELMLDAENESSPIVSVPAAPIPPESNITVEIQTIDPVIEMTRNWTPTGLELLFLIWVLGAVGSALWQLISYLKWKHENKLWNRPVENDKVLNLFYELCQEQGISKFPLLMMNKRIQSPIMVGLLSPAILLPMVECSEDDYAVIFTHELKHYKRRDLWYKLLLLASRCVHWFNPLVWLMLREADNDLEISCDEAVVKNRSIDDRAFYCETILRIMRREKNRYAMLSTGFQGGKKVLQRRFDAVLNDRAGKGFVLCALSMTLLIFFSSFISFHVKELERVPLLPVVNLEKEEEEIQYKAIPENQRFVVEYLSKEVRTQVDTKQYLETSFWEEKAKNFFLADFELSDDITSKEIADFFHTVVVDQDFYYFNGWRSEIDYSKYVIPDEDIWAILRSHLPDEMTHWFEPAEAFNEAGEKNGPYYEDVGAYLFNRFRPNYAPKVMEVTYSMKDSDIITVELASYDIDKYYADLSVKEIAATYRFSVRAARDSWFLLEADISETHDLS